MIEISMLTIWYIISGVFLSLGTFIIYIESTSTDKSLTVYAIAAICIIAGIGFINCATPFIKVIS